MNNEGQNTKDIVPIQENQSYEVKQEKVIEKGAIINYPQIIHLSDMNKQMTLNQVIKDQALKVIHFYQNESGMNIRVEIDYELTRQSDRILSVQFSGVSYAQEQAYPVNIFYTLNLDINKGTRLQLSDFISVDNHFFDLVKRENLIVVNQEQQELINDFATDDLINMLVKSDSKDIGDNFQSTAFSYLTDHSIGLSFPVIHAAGDHAEIEINFTKVPNVIKHNKELWKELLKQESQ